MDVTEEKGKVERDLLYAKQEMEKCYMASIGRYTFWREDVRIQMIPSSR